MIEFNEENFNIMHNGEMQKWAKTEIKIYESLIKEHPDDPNAVHWIKHLAWYKERYEFYKQEIEKVDKGKVNNVETALKIEEMLRKVKKEE